MFGDKELVGLYELKLNNNRFKLPNFTCVEPKEELYYFKYIKYICLMNEAKLNSITNIILSKVNKDYNYDYYRKYIRNLFAKLMDFEIVNSKKEILLPKKWIDEFNFKDRVFIEGNIDHKKKVTNSDF